MERNLSIYLLYIFRIIFLIVYSLTDVLCTKCFKDDTLGDVEGNVYQCNDESKPECCEENQEFTCCQTQSQKTLEEQLILWGSVIGACLLIAIIFCCLFKDVKCCGSKLTLRQRFCKCCKCCQKKEEEEPVEPKLRYRSKYEPFPRRGRSLTDEDLKIRPETSKSGTLSSIYQYY